MTGLLADGWFYISSAGLLVSGVLFIFLLGQYRAAADAADQTEAEAPEVSVDAHAVVRPLTIPEASAAPAKVASVQHEPPAEKPAPAPEPAATPVEKRRENTTGGINPAVVYLQNIKNQLEEIHQENRELAKRVEAITNRDEALIERLAELAQAVADIKSAGPALVAQAPVEAAPAELAPRRAKKTPAPAAEPAPAPTPEPVPAPIPAPVTEPVAAAEAQPTLSIEPTTTSGVSQSKPAAAEPVEEPESEKPRRGPVWPV